MHFRPLLFASACAWLCACAALAALAQCGGATEAAGTADGAVDATASDGGTGADDTGDEASLGCGFSCDAGDERVPFVVCAPTVPADGSACAVPGEVCEYGTSWWLECNVVVRCTGGAWQPLYGGMQCPWLEGGGACPATWAEASAIEAGTACAAADCQYPQGYCECGGACGGGGAPRPPLYGLAWTCAEASAECPSPRPRSGTPCGASDASCNYGWSCGCGQSMQCVDGIWQGMASPPCP
ncbi:MAG TPA: hypothetical protein VIF15_01365 [Polyangiaceae bacterium]|jgi:hypothetical protein